jgi:hypothetical protein
MLSLTTILNLCCFDDDNDNGDVVDNDDNHNDDRVYLFLTVSSFKLYLDSDDGYEGRLNIMIFQLLK